MQRTFRLDLHVVDVVMPDLVGHDRTPAAFVVYLYLWARTRDVRDRTVRVSYRTIAAETGLSKTAAQAAVRTLLRRRFLRAHRERATAVPIYTVLRPWRR